MKSSFLICIATIMVILTISFGMAAQIRYDMPFKTKFNNLSPQAKAEVECLAENIYFESAYEPKQGQIAVAFVTLNRVKSGLFETDICGVVKQKIRNVCQFSWYCEDKPYRISTEKRLTSSPNSLYNDIRELAVSVYINYERMIDPSNGALFYHADYVNPGWRNMKTTAVVGRHIFYNRTGKGI
jgi:spore germination cell wall hydrolase CwlJ-like protein